jgi:hypothetical protein
MIKELACWGIIGGMRNAGRGRQERKEKQPRAFHVKKLGPSFLTTVCLCNLKR